MTPPAGSLGSTSVDCAASSLPLALALGAALLPLSLPLLLADAFELPVAVIEALEVIVLPGDAVLLALVALDADCVLLEDADADEESNRGGQHTCLMDFSFTWAKCLPLLSCLRTNRFSISRSDGGHGHAAVRDVRRKRERKSCGSLILQIIVSPSDVSFQDCTCN